MKGVWRSVARDDGDVCGQHGVQRVGRATRRRPAVHREARDLPTGMHARVRPPCDDKPAPRCVDGVEGGAKLAFHRSQPRLRGPPGEAGPVVLERQLQGRHVGPEANGLAPREILGIALDAPNRKIGLTTRVDADVARSGEREPASVGRIRDRRCVPERNAVSVNEPAVEVKGEETAQPAPSHVDLLSIRVDLEVGVRRKAEIESLDGAPPLEEHD